MTIERTHGKVVIAKRVGPPDDLLTPQRMAALAAEEDQHLIKEDDGTLEALLASPSCERCWHDEKGLGSTASHKCGVVPLDLGNIMESTDAQRAARFQALGLALRAMPNPKGSFPLTGARFNQTIDLAERFAKWIERGER